MMFFKSRCYNGGNKHDFKPRYDEQPLATLSLDSLQGTSDQIRAFRELYIHKVYIKDVCVWCGLEIIRG